jgi:hypothetical protein
VLQERHRSNRRSIVVGRLLVGASRGGSHVRGF